MIFLLGFDRSNFVKFLWKRYPNIKKVSLEASKEGHDIIKISVDILTITLPDMISHMPEKDRAEFISYLEGKTQLEAVHDFFKIVSVFICQIEKLKIQQKLDQYSYKHALNEIAGSCLGNSFEDRQKDRIFSLISNTLFSNVMPAKAGIQRE